MVKKAHAASVSGGHCSWLLFSVGDQDCTGSYIPIGFTFLGPSLFIVGGPLPVGVYRCWRDIGAALGELRYPEAVLPAVYRWFIVKPTKVDLLTVLDKEFKFCFRPYCKLEAAFGEYCFYRGRVVVEFSLMQLLTLTF
ncbi:hypothetical protein L484_023021 [Morus notabilis]|uniref:Uncharacterized protein n=1 Tax=Morus notabilis TaxID=981085 RepID=W9RVU0_9ROSA|nr:hypothetical protein L484_023021 [Morus notabilis]